MALILKKLRTTDGYLARISTEPKKTIENKKLTINNFKKFANEKHNTRPEGLCGELLQLKKQDEEKYNEILYELLQEWINWNISRKLGAYTIKARFSNLREYLYFLGIKTNTQDIKQLLTFPKITKEEKYPLKKNELRDIILAQSRYPKRQALYLALSSSGMRIGEALNIHKKDLDFSLERIMVRIRPEYTKTKEGRTTFLSKECAEKVNGYIDRLTPDDFVFSDSNSKDRDLVEQHALVRALQKLGLVQKYSSNNIYKITSHSFRAYYFTHAARKHGENYAHKLTGHGGYLMQYDRMTETEKLKMYLELEHDLVVFEQTQNELKIERLQKENENIEDLRKEVKKLKESQAKQDKIILENLRKDGILLHVKDKI